MVSKHRESAYRGGRFRHWVKIKNRAHPAFSRVQDQFRNSAGTGDATLRSRRTMDSSQNA
jgi:ATP-dependent DNA ligase